MFYSSVGLPLNRMSCQTVIDLSFKIHISKHIPADTHRIGNILCKSVLARSPPTKLPNYIQFRPSDVRLASFYILGWFCDYIFDAFRMYIWLECKLRRHTNTRWVWWCTPNGRLANTKSSFSINLYLCVSRCLLVRLVSYEIHDVLRRFCIWRSAMSESMGNMFGLSDKCIPAGSERRWFGWLSTLRNVSHMPMKRNNCVIIFCIWPEYPRAPWMIGISSSVWAGARMFRQPNRTQSRFEYINVRAPSADVFGRKTNFVSSVFGCRESVCEIERLLISSHATRMYTILLVCLGNTPPGVDWLSRLTRSRCNGTCAGVQGYTTRLEGNVLEILRWLPICVVLCCFRYSNDINCVFSSLFAGTFKFGSTMRRISDDSLGMTN